MKLVENIERVYPMDDLTGKVALITGGNSGIGLATAKKFKEAGAHVAISGLSHGKLAKASEELGGDIIADSVDVTSLPDLKTFVEKISAEYGKIDVLVNSAGGVTVRPFEMMDEQLFDTDMDRNFKGAYFATQYALPFMGDGSSIIFLGSAAGSKGFQGMSVYGPSKAALRNLARVLASELSPKGIRVNTVSPGPIPTPGMDRLGLPEEQLQQAKAGFESMVPLARMGTPENIADAILFLSSDKASYITGVELGVDGGMVQV